MIQIITGDYLTKRKFQNDSKYSVSDFKGPKAFDEFDINVIDLSFSQLWENKSNSTQSVNMIKDLEHYRNIIKNTDESKIIVVFPQNIYFKYCYISDTYKYAESIKNLLELIQRLIIENIYGYSFKLEFETTKTILNNSFVNADFHFCSGVFEKEKIVLTSNRSNKITTIKIDDNLYYTTLNVFESKEILEEFLNKAQIVKNAENEKPKWIEEINILNDLEIKDNIQQIEKSISEKIFQKEIELNKLKANNKIKSILYQTDKDLQKEIIEILNELLDFKDEQFVDEMEEDYRIKKENITFLIETKGLLRNIKGEDISKTSNHVEIYKDKLDEEGVQENVKGIYIVCTQRNKKVEEREKTPDRQISLAKRNEILIIRTEVLIKLYEAFRNGKINTEEIIEEFKGQKGEFEFNKE